MEIVETASLPINPLTMTDSNTAAHAKKGMQGKNKDCDIINSNFNTRKKENLNCIIKYIKTEPKPKLTTLLL